MVRRDQMGLLRWVLAAIDDGVVPPPLPDLDLARLQAAGVASGLTAAVGVLAARRAVPLPAAWRDFVAEQEAAVAARRRRYASLLPHVLAVLHGSGVVAVPVKGAVSADLVWPVPDARPMADIDLVVRPSDRARAVAALVADGLVLVPGAPGEDVLLAWGDGSPGPTDRESAGHNGKVELHPGWFESVHEYSVGDGGWLLPNAIDGDVAGVQCRLLPVAALTAHSLGHLSVCTIRAEVRAVNVCDVALLLRSMDATAAADFVAACDELDPRLTAPGLWLVAGTRPAWLVPSFDLDGLVARQLGRLSAPAARRLRQARPDDVLRELGSRTSVGWRLAFTTCSAERLAVLRQAVTPHADALAATRPGTPLWQLQARRGGRAVRRAGVRATGRAV